MITVHNSSCYESIFIAMNDPWSCMKMVIIAMKYCCSWYDILDHGYEMPLIIGEKNYRGYELYWSCDDDWHIHVIMKVFMTHSPTISLAASYTQPLFQPAQSNSQVLIKIFFFQKTQNFCNFVNNWNIGILWKPFQMPNSSLLGLEPCLIMASKMLEAPQISGDLSKPWNFRNIWNSGWREAKRSIREEKEKFETFSFYFESKKRKVK